MTPDRLARLHAACFLRPRPWTTAEFAGLLESPAAFLLSRPHGFLVGRVVADEAEVLTLAVDPATRRQGIARTLLAEFAATSRAKGAARSFLEVAADNTPAQALYHGAGWREAGRRRRYYADDLDAIVMVLDLNHGQQGG